MQAPAQVVSGCESGKVGRSCFMPCLRLCLEFVFHLMQGLSWASMKPLILVVSAYVSGVFMTLRLAVCTVGDDR